MRDFLQLVYKVVVQEEELVQTDSGGEGEDRTGRDDAGGDAIRRQLVTLSCVGVGFSNFSKGIM